jgi:hypothetical protein
MTTITKCVKHTPNISAISEINLNGLVGSEKQYTFCETCEQNISRFWLTFDGDRLDQWSSWQVD